MVNIVPVHEFQNNKESLRMEKELVLVVKKKKKKKKSSEKEASETLFWH